MEEIRIPDTYRGLPVVSIGNGAFSSATNVRSLVIPSTINSIAGGWLFLYASAFGNWSDLTSVFIKGDAFTASVGNGNSNFDKAKKYYYSETQPTAQGDYWHYDEAGRIAIWAAEEAENA